jgi:hypothetical protein
MRKLAGSILIIAFTIFAIIDVVRSIKENDPVHFFFTHPAQLLVAGGIGIAGGLIWLLHDRLPWRGRRRIELLLWGIPACILTSFLGWLFYHSSEFSRAIGVPPVLLGIISIIACAASLWFEFYKAFRRKKHRVLAKI